MNKSPASMPSQRLRLNGNGSTNGHTGNGHAPEVNGARAQAQEMTSLVLALTRRLLALDDPAAELPLRQLRVCMALYEQPRSMSELSRELAVTLSAMTQIADRLERSGLVKRSSEQSDRRVRSLQLTARGQRIMRMREQTRIDRVSKVLEQMPQQSRRDVLAALTVLLDACNSSNGDAA